jgi:hypothetical protein
MSAPSDTFLTAASVGNRESLHDKIFMLKTDETPFLSAIGSGSAKATNEEWQTDSLGSASSTNYHLEGDDSTNAAIDPTVRVGNRTQIFKKTFQISRTQEQIDKAGRDSEISYQTAKKGRQMKMDIESELLRNRASNAESGATPRKLGGVLSWLTSNVSRGSGGSSGGFTSGNTVAATNGTQRAFTETQLQTILGSAWTNGGMPSILLLGQYNKAVASGFAGIATQTQEAGGKAAKIIASADIYKGDFHTIKFVPDRFVSTRDAIAIDPDMASVLWLSKIKREALAKTGDAEKFHLVGELTLKVNNEAAHGVVADLTTA